MKRKFIYVFLCLIGIMGLQLIGSANAAGVTIIDSDHESLYSGLKFDDGNGNVIILLDRNLGATTRGSEGTDTYGFHFQWGNNFGFASLGSIPLGNDRVSWDSLRYENIGYSGGVFITGDYFNNDYWVSNLHYDGLRGGSGDNVSNRWGLLGMTEGEYADRIVNIKNRRGPCPSSYHVPSIGEWNNLIKYRAKRNNYEDKLEKDDNTGLYKITFQKAVEKFMEDFYIPVAGRRNLTGEIVDNISNLWSSSLSGVHARSVEITPGSEVDAGEFYFRIIGQSVRCFWDGYLYPEYTVSFYDGDVEITSGVVRETNVRDGEIPIPTKEGYHFDYRYLSGGDEMTNFNFATPIMENIILKAHWTINQYTITFVKGNGEDNYVFTGNYGSGLIPPANPKRAGYTFKGWDQNVPDTIPDYDMTINAVREKSGGNGGSSGGGGSSNGGGSNKTGENNTTSGTNTTTSGTDKNDTQGNTQISSGSTQNNNQFTDEFQQAYEFAYNNGITTMPTIGKANMGGKLTRIAMAKMLSQYAINILGKNPDITKVNKFNDVTDELDEEYNNGVTLAYQLGIMGINMPENNFRPKDEVTRAEFVTALSRMIYGTSDGEYKGTGKYYLNHMAKLMKEGIITKDDPNMKELRGYVMIMLMRSIKG